MKDIWNEICADLQDCIKRDVLEKEYEETIANCMRLLKWRKYDGEIITQYPIQVGHETKLADIVLSSNGVEQFVIEVKRPSHTIQEEDKKQLLSYMRMLKHPVKFGIYIGENIRLFYDDLTSEPTEICTIAISEDDPNGIKFLELCHKDNYTPQAILDFYEDIKHKQAEEQEKKDTVAKILNDREGEGFRELLREKLLIEGHADEWIDDVFGQFKIMVSSTIVPQSATTKVTEISYTKAPINHGEKDNTKYNIFGLRNLSKGKFVHAVIKHYVQQFPMTYNDYVHVFNQKGNRATIKLLAEVTDPIRYLMQQEYHLLSVDGKLFVVSTQWTKTNIQFMEEFALQQGYSFTTT